MSDRWIIPTWIESKSFVPKGPFHHASQKSSKTPLTLREVGVDKLLGRKAIGASWCLGSYGMGGPGFVGIAFENTITRPYEWLVLRVWGADEWLYIDGNNDGWKTFPKSVKGQVLTKATIRARSCFIKIGKHTLTVSVNAGDREKYAGTGGKRVQPYGTSLLDAFVVVPVELEDDFPQLIV